MDESFGIQTVLTLVIAAVALGALYFIVRAAIVSALTEDRRRVERASRSQNTP